MAEYLEFEKVLDDRNIITVQTKEYGSIEVIPVDTITDIELADVQPVKHGRWECVGHDDKTYWYRCSVCGHEEHDNMTKHDNYCGSCGARMNLKDGDTNG